MLRQIRESRTWKLIGDLSVVYWVITIVPGLAAGIRGYMQGMRLELVLLLSLGITALVVIILSYIKTPSNERPRYWRLVFPIGSVVVLVALPLFLNKKERTTTHGEPVTPVATQSNQAAQAVPQSIPSASASAPPRKPKHEKPGPTVGSTRTSTQHHEPENKTRAEEVATQSPTNVAPFGFAISGGTVNNPTITNNFTPVERHLDALQVSSLDALAASLPDDSIQWFFIETVNAPESANYAAEIEQVFEHHKKTKTLITRMVERPPIPRGVFVLVKDQNDEHFPIAQKIADVIVGAGIGKPSFQFAGPKDMVPSQVKIVIALN